MYYTALSGCPVASSPVAPEPFSGCLSHDFPGLWDECPACIHYMGGSAGNSTVVSAKPVERFSAATYTRRYMNIVWMLLVVLLSGSLGANGLLTTYGPLPGDVPLEAGLLAETNMARRQHGLAPLVQDERLALAARHHAAEMAQLGFMAHTSPTQGSETLSQRLNNAGVMLEAAAENLAFISGSSGLPAATVQGWLDSPGHRANLLGDFSSVGFGTAVSSEGTTYVVQVLGRQPLGFTQVQVRETSRSTLQLGLTFRIMSQARVGLWLGGVFSGGEEYQPGQNSIRFPISAAAPVHVSTGVMTWPYVDGAPFIASDSGWFDPVSGSWTPDAGTNRSELQIDSAAAGWLDEQVWRVELQFESVPLQRIGVWLDGGFRNDVELTGNRLQLDIPAGQAPGAVLSVGIEDVPGSGSYTLTGEFMLQFGPQGQPVLRARNPGS